MTKTAKKARGFFPSAKKDATAAAEKPAHPPSAAAVGAAFREEKRENKRKREEEQQAKAAACVDVDVKAYETVSAFAASAEREQALPPMDRAHLYLVASMASVYGVECRRSQAEFAGASFSLWKGEGALSRPKERAAAVEKLRAVEPTGHKHVRSTVAAILKECGITSEPCGRFVEA